MLLTYCIDALSCENEIPIWLGMPKLSNILNITVKTNLEVFVVEIYEIRYQNKMLHAKIKLRDASNPLQ